MDGQSDMFDLLDDKPPVPPFTVYTCVWTNPLTCGWCGAKNTHGGGAGRLPGEPDTSMFYDYCRTCSDKYGHPRHDDNSVRLEIIRTITPRPGGLPDLSGNNKEGG